MFKGIDITAIRKYVSPKDPDKENPTVFHIGYLDQRLQAHIDDKCTTLQMSTGKKNEKADAIIAARKRNYDLVKYSVRDIENFIDPKSDAPLVIKLENHGIGKESKPALPDSVMDMLGSELIEELAEQVMKTRELSEEEEKN